MRMRNGMSRLAAPVALSILLLGPMNAAARSADSGPFLIQVFALVGPACPVVISGQECPDLLLPGARLVLERRNRSARTFQEVKRFETNSSGYANLTVERRGIYRVDVLREPVDGIFGPTFFAGPVTFKVPARHEDGNSVRATPVVVHFDSGIS